jgi:hypothetical protein
MMNKHSFYRPTTIGLALMQAASKPGAVSSSKPAAATWLARSILSKAEHTKLGLTVEQSNLVQ